MKSLRELFRIGHGPSSSHTMAPARAAEQFLQRFPQAERFEVTLYGSLAAKPDAEVIDALVRLKGVGVWTAEMLLIFSLCRRDVLSYRDLGIRRGVMRLYGVPEPTEAEFEYYRRRYSPCGTLASLYLWKIKDDGRI